MKWIITFLAIATCTIACEKSSMMVDASRGEMKTGEAKNELVGSWKLIQYFESDGAGNGTWKTPAYDETISFGSDGSFSSTPTFPLYGMNYNHYAVKNSGTVLLFKPESASGDPYQYVLESPTQLLFYPACREQCMRRYQLK